MENKLKKCPNCGSEIASVTTQCPICGYNFLQPTEEKKQKLPQTGTGIAGMVLGILALLLSCTFIGALLAIFGFILSCVGLAKKYYGHGTAITGLTTSVIAIVIALIVGVSPDDSSKSKKDSYVAEATETPINDAQNNKETKNNKKNDNTTKLKKTPNPTKKPTPKATKQPKRKKLTKAQYKKQCKMLYHDDVFFTKKDIGGKFVKLRLFIGEEKFFDTYIDYETQEFIKKNKIQRDFYECYVKRKGSSSYVSNGTVTVYLPKNFKSSKYQTGKYITVYGKVSSFSKNTWSGYNSVSVVAKYIDNGKR